MVGLPVFGIFTCTRMLMHVIAHRGCANTMRQSALEVNSGRKILCCNRELNPCHLAFQSDACKSPNARALFCMVWSVPLYLCCCNTNSEGHKTCLLLIDSKWMCFDLALMGFCFYFMGPLKKKYFKLYNFYRCQCYLYGWSILLLSELTCTFKCNIM